MGQADGSFTYTPEAGFRGIDLLDFSRAAAGVNISLAARSAQKVFDPASVHSLTLAVHYRTQDDTATTADNDYLPVSGSVQIPPNSDRALISIPINDDSKFEANEAFYFEVTAAENALLDEPLRELVGILDDDGLDNRPPTARNDVIDRNKGIMAGRRVAVLPLGNDTDPDGDALSIVRFQERTAHGGTVTVGFDASGNADPNAMVYTAPIPDHRRLGTLQGSQGHDHCRQPSPSPC